MATPKIDRVASCLGQQRVVLGAFLAASVAWAPNAQARSRMPVSHVARPLTLQQRTLRVDGGPGWPFPTQQFRYTRIARAPDAQSLSGGVSYGIDSDLQVGAALPVNLVDLADPEVGDPLVHVLYRFESGSTQAGFFGALNIPLQSEEFQLLGGIPLLAGVGGAVRLDTGIFFQILTDSSDVVLLLPALLPIQISPNFYFGPESGLVLPDLDTIQIPVGVMAGISVPSSGQLLAEFSFRLRLPDVETTDVVEGHFGVELFFDL